MAQAVLDFTQRRRASFKFNAIEWMSSQEIQLMTLADRGKFFTQICHAVDVQDFVFLSRYRRYVESVKYPSEHLRENIPSWMRDEVFARDGRACVKCQSILFLALDHIFPVSKGGPTTVENLRVLCRSCNSRKGARLES